MYIIQNLLAFNSPLFWTYFISIWKFLRIALEVFFNFISWQQWALQGDTLHIGVIQIRCIWGTSIVNRQCWIFLDEPQSFFYACLSFRLSVQFYTCFDLIMCLLCLLYHLIYHHSFLIFCMKSFTVCWEHPS